ncbi:MAG: TetR/AcrR family transcriptional regulator [Solirubrobacterales bacterium]
MGRADRSPRAPRSRRAQATEIAKLALAPDQRARVRDALIDLCFERGFQQVTAEALCQRAGIERATFDAAYADLTDCFMQVSLSEAEEFHRRIGLLRGSEDPWRERVRATAYELLRYFKEDEKRTHFGIVEGRSAGERVQHVIAAEIEAMVDLIDEGRQCLDDPESLTRATAEEITGGIFNQLYLQLSRGPLPPEEDHIPQMMYVAVLPYLGPEAALEELNIRPPPHRYPSTVSLQGKRREPYSSPELGPLPGGHHGLSPEQVAESQRERLLAAVAHVSAQRGYRAATITEIVKAASVSSRVFYEHFSSKEECFLAAFDAVCVHLTELIVAAVEPIPDWPTRVIVALRTALRFFAAEPDLARLCLLESVTATPAIAARFRAAALAAVPSLAAGRSERSGGEALPESTEDSLLGGLIALTSRTILAGSEALEALLPDLVEFVLSPYLGPEAAKKLVAKAVAPSSG